MSVEALTLWLHSEYRVPFGRAQELAQEIIAHKERSEHLESGA